MPGKKHPDWQSVQVAQYQCILHVDLHSHVCTFNSPEEATPLLMNMGLTVSYMQLE